MKEKKSISMKMAAVLLAACLLIGGTVGGTLAWLVSETGEVTNTFAVGNINISINETKRENYKIVPGGRVEKDPTITVTRGSEKCHVYALVENNVQIDNVIVATPNMESTWTEVANDGTKTLYRYNSEINVLEAKENLELPIFKTVDYADEEITEDNIDTLSGKTIVVSGYAHQSENVELSTANAAAKAWAEITTP